MSSIVQVPEREENNFMAGYVDGRADEKDNADSAFPHYKKENGGEVNTNDLWYWLGYEYGLKYKSKKTVLELTGLVAVARLNIEGDEQ